MLISFYYNSSFCLLLLEGEGPSASPMTLLRNGSIALLYSFPVVLERGALELFFFPLRQANKKCISIYLPQGRHELKHKEDK